MSTDYDAPRVRPEDEGEDEGLTRLRAGASASAERAGSVEDEANLNEDLELPGADLSGEALSVQVLPKQADEFTCTRCFLVVHQSQRSSGDLCRDCA